MTEHFSNVERNDKSSQNCADTDKLGFALIMAQSIRDADQNKDGITTKNEIAKAAETADTCPARYLEQAEIEFDQLAAFAPQSLAEIKLGGSVDEVRDNVWSSLGDVRKNDAGISEKDLSIAAALGSDQKYDRFIGDFKQAESEYRNSPLPYAAVAGSVGVIGTAVTALFCQPCVLIPAGITIGGVLFNFGRGIARHMTYKSELPEFEKQLQNRLKVLERMTDRIRKLD